MVWPGSGNIALFKETDPSGGAYTVTVQAGGVTAGSLEFQNSLSANSTATLTGGAITLSNGGTGVLIKNSAAGNGSAVAINLELQGSENVTFTLNSNLQLNTAATYTGTTTVTTGNLRLAVNNALPTGTALTMSGGSILLGGNRSLTVASLAGSSINSIIRTNGTGTSTLTVNGSANTTYAGQLNNGSTGQLVALTKAGTGTLTLSNSSHSYTGATTISGGTLKLGNTAATHLANTTSILINGGTFDQIIGSGSGTFGLANTTLALSGATSVTGTYQLFSGFASGTIDSLTITGLNAGLFGSLGSNGLLTVSAIPEPSMLSALAGIAALGTVASRRHRRSSF